MPRSLVQTKGSHVSLDLTLEQFFRLRTTIADEATRAHYRRAVHWLGESIGRPAKLSDLTDDNLAGLLVWLVQTRGQQATTANGAHKCLSSLWRWAHNRGLKSTGPTVKALRTPQRVPRAWRRDELTRLITAARQSPGSICGIPARVWWVCLFALEWDTGCRAGELLSLRWEWLDDSTGWIVAPAEVRKGKLRDAAYGLTPSTLEALRPIRLPVGLILRWEMHRSRYWQLWNELLDRAGLPRGRAFKTQALRRSFASWLKVGGGDATAACGNGSQAMTARHYLDPALTQQRHGDDMPFHVLELGESS